MKKNYLLSADLIRTLAIIGVVLSHITIAVSGRPDFFNGISWWLSVIIGTLSRASIPFFILLSGYFILGKSENFKTSVLRTLKRIILPLIFWVLIYTYLPGGLTLIDAVKSLPFQLFETNIFHLYFLEITIGLYLISPILSLYLFKYSKSSQKLMVILFLILGGLYAVFQFLTGECADNIFTIWIPYIGLYLAGFVLGKSEINRGKLLIISLFFFLLTLILNYVHAFVLFKQNINLFSASGCISDYPNYFLSFNVILMSIPLFMVLLKFNLTKLKNTFLEKIIKMIAGSSYGIFLIHLLILQLLDSRLHLFDPIAPAWLYILIKLLVIFILSLIITVIIKKIPLLRKVIGEK